jgi:hypothetical protein
VDETDDGPAVDVARRPSAARHPLSTTPPPPTQTKTQRRSHATPATAPPEPWRRPASPRCRRSFPPRAVSAAEAPSPRPPARGRARASSSATRLKVPLPSPRLTQRAAHRRPMSHSTCCFCRWIAVQAGGDLQRTGGGADQHYAGDPRPADEHTGGGRHGDAGAPGGSQGAGRGLRRQVPRQAAPSARRFPQRLGRHRRQCRATLRCESVIAAAVFTSCLFTCTALRITGVIILCASLL